MLRGYVFLVGAAFSLSGLAWWSHHIEPSNPSGPVSAVKTADFSDPEIDPATLISSRRELMEVLDRIVAYESYYRSIYGHFTRFLGRIGLTIPKQVSDLYEVRIDDATENSLVVGALSEVKGRTTDVATIDQDYHLNCNFEIPQPRPEYLRAEAMKQLRLIRSANDGKIPEEQGVYRGYFKYVNHSDGSDRTLLAIGIKAPVLGVQLELSQHSNGESPDGDLAEVDTSFDPDDSPSTTGQKPQVNVMTTLEEARLAQTIFRGEMGRYARSWAELSKIAAFNFSDANDTESVPFGDSPVVKEIDAHQLDGDASGASRRLGSVKQSMNINGLEIEPVDGNP